MEIFYQKSKTEVGQNTLSKANHLKNGDSSAHSKYRSQKSLIKPFVYSQIKTQNAEQPFYFKLSNSPPQQLKRRIDSKPQLLHLQKMKNILNEDYSSQIQNMNNQKRQKERMRIMEERDYLSHFEKHHHFELQQKKRLKSQYSNVLQQQIHKRQLLSNSIKTQQHKYDLNFKPRQNSLLHKAESFRKFYQEACRYRESVARQYESYMQQEKKYEEKRNKSKLQNLQVERKEYGVHKEFQNNMSNYKRQTLKQILQRQIEEKSDITKRRAESEKISNGDSKMEHHPINNPIDYKTDITNKYIPRQLEKGRYLF